MSKLHLNLYIKIILLLLAVNAGVGVALALRLDPPLVLAATLGVSLAVAILIYLVISPIARITKKAKLLVSKSPNQIQESDELALLDKSIDLVSQYLTNTYSQLALERDLLSAEKNKLGAIISSITEGIIVVDLHRQVVLANKAAEEITGFIQEEMHGQKIDQLLSVENALGKSISPLNFCPINLDGSPTQIFYQPEDAVFLIGKDKKKTKVIFNSASVDGSIRADLGCVLILHNLTKESSFESMQIDFVSMASHELRTPLTSILGYLRVLSDEAKNTLSNEQKDFLNKALTSAQQLSNLVTNLLNVSRVERRAISVNALPLDLLKLLTLVVDENRLQASQKRISLNLEKPDKELPLVLADNIRITEVLNNLIGNAINYTGEGGSIKINLRQEDDKVTTAISDTGKGIPADAIPHLFTKFFRVANAQDKSSSSKGTGLGLYLSKSIIDLHHGRIWVESILGKGSTFYFSLPITQALPTSLNGTNLKLSSSGAGLTTSTKTNILG